MICRRKSTKGLPGGEGQALQADVLRPFVEGRNVWAVRLFVFK
jgi:hypothetical protein